MNKSQVQERLQNSRSNVWFQSVKEEYAYAISNVQKGGIWSVAATAQKGDLVLFYRASPYSSVQDIFYLLSDAREVEAGWKPGLDHMAQIRRACTLKEPIRWKDSPFVRMQMQGRFSATDYWPQLYQLIVSHNPDCEKALAGFIRKSSCATIAP
jgi:hypothetical protein